MASKRQTDGSSKSRREVIAAIEAEQRTKNIILWSVIGVVIAVVVFVIGFVVVTALSQEPKPQATGNVDEYVIPYGDANAKVAVDIYFDFMCPGCGTMEQNNGEALKQLADDGIAYLKLHPLSFLDQMSNGTRYSTRAANAYVTVAKEAPEKFMDFNLLLYANQPEEGSDGLDDATIASLAITAGVPQEIVDTFADLKYESWVEQSTALSLPEDGDLRSTPGVRINGKLVAGFSKGVQNIVDPYSPGVLIDAIKEAANG